MLLKVITALALLVSPGPVVAEEHEIGVGDVIKVSVQGQDQLAGDFTVDPEGMIVFPLLGPVKASGMTSAELQRKLTTLLADGYLNRPTVDVSIEEYWGRRVFVTGEIESPGAYALKGDPSLLALLNEIGNPTPDAGHMVMVIRPPPEPAPSPTSSGETPLAGGSVDESDREPEGTTSHRARYPNEVPGAEVLEVMLEELRSGNPERNIELKPGDTVFFPRFANIYVTGQIARPGAYRYQPRTTVFQALNVAGGMTSRGSKKVRIIRMIDGKQKDFRVKMTDLVEPEDTIFVPERFF